ncbi:MAG: hypothetical protein J2P17_03625 [Mycobacterium sp.]|nr:hypothetical protein [Mycobacterium sp.]
MGQDRHLDPVLGVRAPADVTTRARKNLEDRDRRIRGFVVACLNALNAKPDEFLRLLEEHWPPPKRPGRPLRRPPSTEPVRPTGSTEEEQP